MEQTCIKTFSDNLNSLIDAKGISQKELCKVIGISEATLSCMTKGKRNPSLDTVFKIAKYFDVSIDDLVGFDPIADEFNKLIAYQQSKIILLDLYARGLQMLGDILCDQ